MKKTCRLCLQVGEGMFKLGNTDYKEFIASILKLKGFNYVLSEDYYACYLCTALLRKAYKFMQMVLNAQRVLDELLKADKPLTTTVFVNLDRQKLKLDLIRLNSEHGLGKPNTTIYDPDIDTNNINTNSSNNEIDVEITTTNESKSLKPSEEQHENIKENERQDFLEIINEKNEEDGSNQNIEESEETLVTKLTEDLKSASELDNEILSDDHTETEISSSIEKRSKEKKTEDKDYQPDSTSHSEDSEFDSYDDEGKRIRVPEDRRVYPMKCDHCDYEIEKKIYHYHHYLVHHPDTQYPYKREKTHACSICGQLQTRARLFSHEENHKQKVFKCPLCPKICYSSAKLGRHRRNVHPKRTLTCDYCSKVFKTRLEICRHIRTHTGEKPFKCHICGAGFAHSGNRSIHIRSAHQNFRIVPNKTKGKHSVSKNRKQEVTDEEIESNNKKTRKNSKKRKNKKAIIPNAENKSNNKARKRRTKMKDDAGTLEPTQNCQKVRKSKSNDSSSDSDNEVLATKKKRKILNNSA